MSSQKSENVKIAIVTGGSRGMGRNTAANLAKRGVDVIFTYHSNRAEAQSLIREVEAIGRKAAAFRLDTADLRAFDGFAADVRKTPESWGLDRFDYLVNNAGNSQHINFDKVTEADFDAVVNVHFKGVFFLTQKLLPLMNDGGRIVNISSGLTRVSCPAALPTQPRREQSRF
jgi:NAD(P)-dependent dehydrogenase (short-subunit alcohol dehydrogenase family)